MKYCSKLRSYFSIEFIFAFQELKHLNIPVVEASSHENVNVDAAFFAVAQLVDKSRGRTRILSYYEAAMGRRQMMDEATDNYLRLGSSFFCPNYPDTIQLQVLSEGFNLNTIWIIFQIFLVQIMNEYSEK